MHGVNVICSTFFPSEIDDIDILKRVLVKKNTIGKGCIYNFGKLVGAISISGQKSYQRENRRCLRTN